MSKIDPSARIEDGAKIGADVTIGPFCTIGRDVVIGDGCELLSHVSISGVTTVGPGTRVFPFASLGSAPQSLAHKDDPTRLEIGANCVIREGVTMNTGTVKGGGVTRVGDRGFFMANAHVAHDCVVGSDVVFANSATLGGHCVVGDFVFIGGLSAVHQFTRIGSQVMIGGMTGVRGDVIPFGLATGDHAYLEGLNIVGMRRRKFTRERIHKVRAVFRELFLGSGTFDERLNAIVARPDNDDAVREIIDFVRTGNHRSICQPRREMVDAQSAAE